jgi:galactarate dehydratase
MQPLYIQLDQRDNVAIVANAGGLPKGTVFPSGLTLTEAVPQAHKVALKELSEGASIIRYGQTIGYAKVAIARGSWIREDLVLEPQAPRLEELPICTNVPVTLPALEGVTFEGFRNQDGTVGTKNILGITTSVQCVAPTVEFAVRRIKAEILRRYPAVDDVVAITHPYGCGIAINAPNAEIPIRTIRNISRNPNLGGEAMVVSLGCEKLQPTRLFPDGSLPVLNNEPWVVRMQDEEYRGFGDIVGAIMRMAEIRLEKLNRRKRVTCPASELSVGMQCGGSDAFSGVTANPAVGYAADLLVRAGATVMFSEVTEVRDAVGFLTARAATPEIARSLVREMAWYDEYLKIGSADRSANTTPGNKRGGLANIVEKALGSVAKSGSTALAGVAGPGERVTTRGLVFAATPASDFICGTLQTAAGMNMHIFTTGEGTPYGLAIVPVIKVSSRTALAERWPDLIDMDAGPIATGGQTVEQIGQKIFELILDVASGRKKTWSDHWGLHNPMALFNPAPVT